LRPTDSLDAKINSNMIKAQSVDEYISLAPKEWQSRLEGLRETIKSVVPKVEESMSYGMPSYHYKGRLVYFSLWKEHIGVYAISSSVLDKFKTELHGYVMPKGTIQFPLDQKLPVDLIKKLVTAQARINDQA
jgi:uncharacterized protein YdhG (YjbR/CyaY superfamily)